MQDAEPKPVTLVTGANRGIGRSLCEHLLARGYLVVGCSRGNCDWSAVGFTHLQADVTDEAQVKSIMHHILSSYGRLDAAINNAGIASMNHVLLTPGSAVEKILATNVLGTFLVSREAAKLMRKRRFGRIINFSTVAVPLHLAGEAAYVASKSAVVALSQVMARELAAFGITVNVIGPAPTDTDLIRGVPDEKIDQIVASLAIQRKSTFADIANVADFFLQSASSAITGQVIYLGGAPNA